MRLATLALLLALVTPAWAQTPAIVTVDGRPLPPIAIVSADGGDAQVVAAAFLRLSGAVIEGGNQFLEAWFPGGILSLSAGSDGYQWNAMPGRLSAPTTTSADGEIVCRASELGRILGMQQEGLAFTTRASGALHSRAAMPGLDQAAAAAPGLLPVPMDTGFSDAMIFDTPPPTSAAGPQDSGSDVPGDLAPPGSASDSVRVALVSFRATASVPGYRLEVVLRNEGTRDLSTPVEVQYLETGSTDEAFQIMDSDLVRTLPAGQTVTLTKAVSLATPGPPRFRAMLLTLAPSGPPLVVGTLDASP